MEKASQNKAAAAALKDDEKVYQFTGVISSIEEEYAVIEFVDDYYLPQWEAEKFCAYAYLPNDLLLKLYENQAIFVSGKITDVVTTTSEIGFGQTIEGTALIFGDASGSTEFELVGTLVGPDQYFGYDYEGAWNINIGGEIYLVIFAEGIDLSEYYDYIDKEVTIKTLIVDGYYTGAMIVTGNE